MALQINNTLVDHTRDWRQFSTRWHHCGSSGVVTHGFWWLYHSYIWENDNQNKIINISHSELKCNILN